MKRDELRKLIVGPIATVPTPFDSDYKVAAAMGEGPQLNEEEWGRLLATGWRLRRAECR